jgi:hypothetical protein
MSRFGKTLFSGSRFIFWSLAPILALSGVLLPFLVAEWTVSSFFFVVLIEASLVALILGLFNPLRFRWATRCVTGVVFCLYLYYAIEEVFLSGKGLKSGFGSRAEASPLNAILGFIVIGLPCLWYTLFGRFSLKRADRSDGGEPEPPAKAETTDFDI